MLFCAEISDYRMIYNVLKAISFKEYAVLRPMEEGLKVTVEEMKCVETSAYIPCNMFSYYHINSSEDVKFKISLKMLTVILNVFGDDGNPSLKLSYKSSGSPLSLVIKHVEDNITVGCEIRTISADDFSDLSLAEECNVSKVVVNAAILVELLQRLDNSADEMKLTISPDPPFFKILTTGTWGESGVSLSKSADSITLYQCNRAGTAQYAFNNIRQVLKVMSYASKVAISTGETGLLGLQLVINFEDKQMYVEYYVTSQFTGDE